MTENIEKMKCDLIKSQYDLLRDAIKNSRERMHQLSLAGVISFPAGVLLSGSKFSGSSAIGISSIFVLSPVLILAFGMLYRSERAALRKYGHYINDYIDPWMNIKSENLPEFITWEQFRRGKHKSETPAHPSEYEHSRNLSLELLIGTYVIAGCILSSYEICYLIFPVVDGEESIAWKRYILVCALIVIEIFAIAYAWRDPKRASDTIEKITSRLYPSKSMDL